VRPTSLQKFTLIAGILALGCSGPDDSSVEGESGGGPPGTGGGTEATGGSGSTGGTAASGGTSGSGGASTGGTATGGDGGSVCTNVQPTGTEWDEATCDQWASETSECSSAWMVDNHYCDESCGRCSSSGTGGAGATGGGGSGGSVVIPDTCSEADRTVSSNGSGTHCGYTYEYWKDSGSGTLTLTSDGFSTNWSGINNLLGRKGRRPGSTNQIVTYDANYQPNGNSYLCVYGWMRSPLVEYYIVDSWGDWRPPGEEQHMGTVSSDGGTYDLYQNQRTGDTIDGYTTFTQYWSVRTTKRESGTITVGNHFSAWANAGMSIGSLYEVSLCVEGYQSSGTADVRMTMQ